jgi:NAD(P)-dependent dehydrogenase (short-subunit alcohol dehydrogenase family)
MKFLPLDLNDISSVKGAAATFAKQESKLDVLWNNAKMGGNALEPSSRTVQGFEPMIGMHYVATLLFTQMLLPQLSAAVSAASGTPGSVHVVWTSAFLIDAVSPINGVEFELLEKDTADRTRNYAVSKVGTWMLRREFARRYGHEGIESVIQNLGNLKAG